MLAIMDSFSTQCEAPAQHEAVATANLANHSIEWRSRYDGLVSTAHVEGKAVAGISGPWSGKFALTWWERPLPARQLELYDSMDEAKREVEIWAQRMRIGGYTTPASLNARARLRDVTESAPVPMGMRTEVQSSLMDRVLTLLPPFARAKSRSSSSNTIDRLRRMQVCTDTDLSGLHFAANE
ncbi:MAG: hypothetical protein ABIW82_12695 [Dokdonella sp.]